MTEKELISVRLETDTKQRVEEYADKHGVSRSVAIRRLLEKGADFEDAGLAVAASRQVGNQQEGDKQEEEKEAMADGSGQVVRPVLSFMGSLYASLSLLLFGTLSLFLVGVRFSFVDYGTVFSLMLTGLILTAAIFVVLYTDLPEEADRAIYARASWARSVIFGGVAEQ